MQNKKFKKAIAAAVVGNVLEWYDFVIYAFFAVYISHNFFIGGTSSEQLIKVFIVYGASFLARPLGAFVLGAYGDISGRKNALSLSIILMATGVGIIAFTPSANDIGLMAPILLVFARLLQGFSAGGEIGSGTAFLLEYAPKDKKAFYTSLFQGCMGLSGVLGSLSGILVTKIFSEADIFEWAWRIPFFVGLLILPVGLYIRRTIEETPEFLEKIESKKETRTPLKDIFKEHKKPLILGIVFSLFWTICPYVFIMYTPAFYMGLGFEKAHVFMASMLGNLALFVMSPFSGYCADKFGIKKMLYISIAMLLLVIFPIFKIILSSKMPMGLILSHFSIMMFISFFMGLGPIVLSKIFITKVRSSGIALTYGIASALTGFSPALMAYLTQTSQFAPAIYVVLFSIPALIAIAYMKFVD